MSDDLPDLSKFDKYLDDEDLEKLEKSRSKAGSGSGSNPGSGGGSGEGRKGRGGRGRPRRWRWLLAGLVLGAVGAVFLPDLARPYLPPALRMGEEEVAGLVLDKRTEGERLLLTVDTDRGATLASFSRRVSEIDLLVTEGDSVTLGLGAYAPLVEDPSLAGVRKGRPGAVGTGSEGAGGTAEAGSPAGGGIEADADTASASGASPPDTTVR